MKQFFFLLAGLSMMFNLAAQNSDLVSKKDFQTEKKKIYDNISASKKIALDAKKLTGKNDQLIDSLKTVIKNQAGTVTAQQDSLSSFRTKFNELKARVDNEKLLSTGVRILLIILLVVLIALLYVLWFYWKRKSELSFQKLELEEKSLGEKLDTGIHKVDTDLHSYSNKTDSTLQALDEKESRDVGNISQLELALESRVRELSETMEARIKAVKEEHLKLHAEQDARLTGVRSEAAKRSEETRAIQKADHAKVIEKIESSIAELKQLLSPVKDQVARLSKDIDDHKQSHLKKG